MFERNLPYIEEIDEPLSSEEFRNFENEYLKEASPSSQNKFNYAWANIKSADKKNQERGIRLFLEITRENPSRSKECSYYLAIGYYRLGKYREAKKHADLLIEFEPKNQQFISLRDAIESKVENEGITGIAIAGGVAALAGAVLMTLFRNK